MNNASMPRYPLHLTISALFILLILVLGAVLSWQNYSKTSDIIRSSAADLYDQVTTELLLDMKATYRPVGDTLGLLALTPVTRATNLEQRLDALDMLREVLRSGPSVAAIQVGYPNGDFIILRPLVDQALRARFNAPDAAAYVFDHVDTATNGTRQLQRIFFSDALDEVGRQPTESTQYDPRVRSWYTEALTGESLVLTQPYLFYFARRVGITLARQTADRGVVVASDVTLENLSATIGRYRVTPGTEVALLTGDGHVIAYPDTARLLQDGNDADVSMARLGDLDSAVLGHLARDLDISPRPLDFRFDGRDWEGMIRRVSRDGLLPVYVLMATPVDELLADAVSLRSRAMLIMLLIILMAVPVVWYTAEKIAGPIRRLADEAGEISRFNFRGTPPGGSFITEVDELARAMELMKATINRFIALINSLASERDFDSLLHGISRETMTIGQADGVLVYLLGDDDRTLAPAILAGSNGDDLDQSGLPEVTLEDDSALANAAQRVDSSLLTIDASGEDPLANLAAVFDESALTLATLPLRNRQAELVGVLCLVYRGAVGADDAGRHRDQLAFIAALSGFAAVSLESRQLLMMQKALLDAFIKLIAGAIDAKSPYTGGHCQRVPALTRMLARAACDSEAAPFSAFSLDDDQWEALDIASWLHDCGKVTTPEYVVDKATKLETLYDRIHEIRTRFEVLKRDAELHYWQQRADGGDESALRAELQQALDELDADFAFVAECNLGGEFMAPGHLERLQRIAARTWTRTLDKRLGVSWEEQQRMAREAPAALPATERLLDDRVEHLITRAPVDELPADNPWGFRMDTPEYKYNRGELYNLSVSRGTLTEEERYKINDHIMQTIIMLEKLPYPRHLREVPLIAGCHHETMDGKGYPKRLTREQMPLTARMMAIADIFEALTASDRPYKKAKTLSEAVRIMGFMMRDQHIDPDLFELFLRSGIYLEYGQRFLQPEQIDAVDIDASLGGKAG